MTDEREDLAATLELARDLLMERKQGNPARSPAHNARLVIEQALSTLSGEAKEEWTCAARRQFLPEPADCNWPVCGCDPYADKVIRALEETGVRMIEATPAQPKGEDITLVRKVLNWAWDAADENSDREWITTAMDAFGRVAARPASPALAAVPTREADVETRADIAFLTQLCAECAQHPLGDLGEYKIEIPKLRRILALFNPLPAQPEDMGERG